MAQNTLYWHDYETFGIDSQRDRPVQFAGVRTDEDLNIIGEPLNIFSRPPRDYLPHPTSSVITGITPQQAREQGIPEAEFIARILEELAQPGTCGVGYNSIRFDDEVTRNTLYRNLYDPYVREWQNGNSRWDIIDMVRMCRDLRPEGIIWPQREDVERSSFKLEELARANQIEQLHAHDALSDVYATIGVARLIKDKQPKLYDFLYKLRRKNEVLKLLDLKEMTPLLHSSGMYGSDHGNTRMVAPIATHPVNKNSVIVFDLSQDPKILLDLSAKKIKELLYTSNEDLPEGTARPALKQVLVNKCPALAPSSTLTGEAAKRLKIDLMNCQMNRQTLLAARKAIQEKLAKVFEPREFEPVTDPDLMIYNGGFFDEKDKALMQTVHRTPLEQLAGLKPNFKDPRLGEMLFRYRARNYPETLSAEDTARWQEHCRARLHDENYFNLTTFAEELAQLRQEWSGDSDKLAILNTVEQYVQDLEASL